MRDSSVLWLTCFLITICGWIAAQALPRFQRLVKRTIWIPALLAMVFVAGSGFPPARIPICAVVILALFDTYRTRDQTKLDAQIDSGILRFWEARARLRASKHGNASKR